VCSDRLIIGQGGEEQSPRSYFPASGAETTNVLIHYYRGEIGRMSSWRNRIDQTSNWAITVVAAMLSVSLSTPTAHHGVLLFAMLLVSLLLFVEARRYRFFDVYRSRVRQFERHYFAEIFSPAGTGADADWIKAIGLSLREPEFNVTLIEAIGRRLRRNYIWMYIILLLAWILKLTSPKLQTEGVRFDYAATLESIVASAALGPLHGGVILLLVAAFYLWLAAVTLRPSRKAGEFLHGDVHV
jgi:uncharacterized membrane protein